MLALIAGRGELPRAVKDAQVQPPLVCALDGCLPDRVEPDHVFRLEHLGRFLRWLKRRGVRQVCMCGAIDRPDLSWRRLDMRTLALVPRILKALRRGDDGALRVVIGIFEQQGFEVLAAHEAAPGLLPPAGIATLVRPATMVEADALLGDKVSMSQAQEDLGQSCVLRDGKVLIRETISGTDAMLRSLAQLGAQGGVFYKAPKPGQERRADLPVIGPQTAARCAEIGLKGLVIEAGGVMVLNQAEVIRRLDAEGMFLWVRERPE
ncbi:LpxI family protein [Tropicibacter alexandrii]|uniref:LpxI family protein n=1 Tax=Tropicibacter alexandrii TaxID=2267683 RepID=UPI000EF479D3|nr:UDP-2,3-diacylglucosamine diphosphatase LpxI [Tropicibacter alexandrii]